MGFPGLRAEVFRASAKDLKEARTARSSKHVCPGLRAASQFILSRPNLQVKGKRPNTCNTCRPNKPEAQKIGLEREILVPSTYSSHMETPYSILAMKLRVNLRMRVHRQSTGMHRMGLP